MDFKKSAELIVKYVGGKQNVSDLTHCYTRLRFSLRDDKKGQYKSNRANRWSNASGTKRWPISSSNWSRCS